MSLFFLMKNIKRSFHLDEFFIKSEDQIISLSLKEFLQKNEIDGIIRIRREDFIFFETNPKFLTHFNLQSTSHKKGKIYALPLIVKQGFFDGKKEVSPILSFENNFIAECLEVKNNIRYKDLKQEDFKDSFPSIQNITQLKKVIVKRYSKSIPNLSQQKILSMGIAITKLKIIKKIKYQKL